MAARTLVAQSQDADPRSMTLDQQRAVSAATDTISRYEDQQAQPAASAGTTNGVPTASDTTPPSGQHPFAPGSNAVTGIRSPLAATMPPGGVQPVTVGAQPGGPQGTGGVQPISFGGAPAGDGAVPASPQAPVAPGRPPPQAGGAVPLGNMPPEVAAALTRLQSRQGSPADGATWSAYLRSVGGAIGGGGASAGGQAGQGGPSPAAPSAPPPSGPDLPNLPKGYQDPGGGTRYVNDVLTRAARFAQVGDPRAAIFQKRAEEIQSQLDMTTKARLDLQTRNAELTPGQKDYQAAVAQGFQGTPLDYLNTIATGKAGAREQARLQADTDPSRLSFAQSEAAARAAGTAQGSAPYKFVSTQPTPGGPTVYTSEADLAGGNAVKDQPAVFGQKQEALGKLDGEMQGQYQQRQVAQERLDAMANLLETFQSGAGADAKAAAVAAVRAAGFNIPDSATANPAAVEQFSKNTTANVFSNAKDMGGRVLVSELEGLQKANANPNMQPASNAAILAQQKGLLNWEDQHYQDYSTWRQANPYATDASSFETAWAKAHPVGAYVAAAKKDIAPLGAPLPAQGQLSDGQAYIVKGQKVRWDAGSAAFVPFTGSTAPTLPGQGSQGAGRGQDRQSQAQGQGQGRGQAPPVAGARQAPDGNWYVSDPGRPGKFMMVAR
jgi:hypothetical protein